MKKYVKESENEDLLLKAKILIIYYTIMQVRSHQLKTPEHLFYSPWTKREQTSPWCSYTGQPNIGVLPMKPFFHRAMAFGSDFCASARQKHPNFFLKFGCFIFCPFSLIL